MAIKLQNKYWETFNVKVKFIHGEKVIVSPKEMIQPHHIDLLPKPLTEEEMKKSTDNLKFYKHHMRSLSEKKVKWNAQTWPQTPNKNVPLFISEKQLFIKRWLESDKYNISRKRIQIKSLLESTV